MALFQDPTFWVMISTVLCVGFIAFKAAGPILKSLDGRATAIHQRLIEAEVLRVEAENILKEYKDKSANALSEADQILKNAQARADQMRTQMEAELNESIARQEQSAHNRIARLEIEAIEAVKQAVVTAAMSQVQGQFEKEDGDTKGLEASLQAITKTLH
jgi:F-type H+-transporting ATPase subunit b